MPTQIYILESVCVVASALIAGTAFCLVALAVLGGAS
jgi:hypothetical protein